jgi:outer membrane immunogenic protein
MKALIAGGAAAVLLGTSALAADMAVKAPPLPPASPWTGYYIGVIAGGAWGTFDPRTSTVEVPGGEINPPSIAAINAAGAQKINATSAIGGLEAGYNWQPGPYLFGLEADIEWLHLSGVATTGAVPLVGGGGTFSVTSAANIDWLATARGRLGYVAANNWLFYVTGGAAFTTLRGNFTFSETISNVAETAAISKAVVGYTVGGGVEVPLSRQWSIKAEYLFVDFAKVSASGTLPTPIPTYPVSHTLDLKLNIARLGANYHF